MNLWGQTLLPKNRFVYLRVIKNKGYVKNRKNTIQFIINVCELFLCSYFNHFYIMARDASYPKIPISIVFATSKNSNAKIKIKTVSNRNIDEIIDMNYRLPGIPEKAIIKEVGMGEIFIDRYKKKYGI